MKSNSTKISELTEPQKSHLVWKLDHNTYVGLLTAMRIANGKFGDMSLFEVFKKADCSDQSAKILSRKVLNS